MGFAPVARSVLQHRVDGLHQPSRLLEVGVAFTRILGLFFGGGRGVAAFDLLSIAGQQIGNTIATARLRGRIGCAER